MRWRGHADAEVAGRHRFCSSQAARSGQRLMARQVDLDRRDRNEAVAHRMKIGTRPGILLGTGRPDPVDRPSARVFRLDHRFRLVAMPKPGRDHTLNLFIRQVWDVDVEDRVRCDRVRAQALNQLRRDPGRGVEETRGMRGDGYGDRRIAQKTPLGGRGHGAGIDDIVTHVGTGIDPGHDHVRFRFEQTGDRQMDAVRRRTLYPDETIFELTRTDRLLERQGIAGTAAVAVRRHHDRIGDCRDRIVQRL